MNRLLVPLLAALISACGGEQTPPRPNIIHIMADDLGYGEIGAYGQQLIFTPNIDRLAREGLRFTQHYAGSTVCSPSRWALLTGQHAGSSGVTGNGYNQLRPEDTTIAELLKDAGYTTAMVGKWSHGNQNSTGYPPRQGFDYWFGYPDQGAAHNYYPEFLYDTEGTSSLAGNTDSPHKYVAEHRQTYAPDIINARAIDFIRQNQAGHSPPPFFLALHYNLPHINNHALAIGEDGMEYPPPGRYAHMDWAERDKGYAEMVSLVDDYVGDIVEVVGELGIETTTLILFTSDNGPTGARGQESLTHFNSSGGLRGFKGQLYEGGIRVPMIAWWPGTVAPGGVTDYPSAFWDLLPTLQELAGLSPRGQSDGVSLAPLLTSGTAPEGERVFYWRFKNWRALRQGEWKWLQFEWRGKLERRLFNLAGDERERTDLSADQPERAGKLLALADQLDPAGAAVLEEEL
jgi:uncharacterized sulfatase